MDPDQFVSNAPTLITGTVWTAPPSFRWLAGLHPQVVTVRGYPAGEELVVELSDDQLVALERARGENDITLRLTLHATLLQPMSEVHPVAEEQVPARITRGRWLELLDQVGSEVGIVLRVPSPLTDSALQPPPATAPEDAASLAQATARIRQARAELRDHQWEHSVATCRRVLENLARLVVLPPVKQVFAIPAPDRTHDLLTARPRAARPAARRASRDRVACTPNHRPGRVNPRRKEITTLDPAHVLRHEWHVSLEDDIWHR